ncbi:MAG: MarR family transcriptional regulator [Chloroflexota bacterium]
MVQPASDISYLLAADSRSALLAALRGSSRPLSVGEAAAAVGISESTARSHLALLVTAGLVTRTVERQPRAGRPSLRYAATGPAAADDSDATGHDDLAQLRHFASVLAGHIGEGADPAAAARRAGQRWSDELAGAEASSTPANADPVEALTGLLDRLGFAPEQPRRDRIWLRRCPFEEVARQHRAVVCGVHQGMLEQSAERLGLDPLEIGLEPFAMDEPLLCVVRLADGAGRADDRGVPGAGGEGDG